ncbi:MAG: peptidoglycan-binding protein [Deltaproteobacteria bacterium]|nr:peptidoglycan-binding protein [Deltaproteobacteria bacterium]
MTTNAVKAFQKKEGLKVDGIIGPKTLKALGVK